MKEKHLAYRVAFGKHVKKLREQRKLSQADLAAIAGIEQNQVYRVENAKHVTSHSTIISIAIALGVTPAELHTFEFDLELKQNYHLRTKESVKNAEFIEKLLETSFFDIPREVKVVIAKCAQEFGVQLKSSPVSGVLKKLTEQNILERYPSPQTKGHFVYKRVL